MFCNTCLFFTKNRPIKQQRLTNEISLVERFFYIVIISLYRLYIFVKNNSILTKYGTTLHTRPKQRKIIKKFQLQRFQKPCRTFHSKIAILMPFMDIFPLNSFFFSIWTIFGHFSHVCVVPTIPQINLEAEDSKEFYLNCKYE